MVCCMWVEQWKALQFVTVRRKWKGGADDSCCGKCVVTGSRQSETIVWLVDMAM